MLGACAVAFCKVDRKFRDRRWNTRKTKRSPVGAKEEEVARAYPKRAERIDELNGHPPGSDGPMLTALGTSSCTARRTGAAMPTDEDDHDDNFLFNHPERGGNFAAA